MKKIAAVIVYKQRRRQDKTKEIAERHNLFRSNTCPPNVSFYYISNPPWEGGDYSRFLYSYLLYSYSWDNLKENHTVL